jgi:hypothetical protein
MAKPSIENLLVPPFPKKHVSSLLKHFSKGVADFQEGEWENCTAKAGKFIEATLKALFVYASQILPTGRGFKADLIINGLAPSFPRRFMTRSDSRSLGRHGSSMTSRAIAVPDTMRTKSIRTKWMRTR